jgi:hypothetical protein
MSSVVISGDTSGAITLAAPAIAGTNTLSLPAVTDTLVGLAATQTLTNKSIVATQLTGTIAAARLPTGSVLQVVQATYSTETGISSTSFVDTGLTASITPSSSSSKILVIASMAGDAYRQSNVVLLTYQNIVRGSTQITEKRAYMGGATSSDGYFYDGFNTTLVYLDSPATTSSTTYKVQGKLDATTNNATLRYNIQNSSGSVIILMEIAA